MAVCPQPLHKIRAYTQLSQLHAAALFAQLIGLSRSALSVVLVSGPGLCSSYAPLPPPPTPEDYYITALAHCLHKPSGSVKIQCMAQNECWILWIATSSLAAEQPLIT